MSQLWSNPTILGFFFTAQAAKTLGDLLDRCEDKRVALEQIDNYATGNGIDADALGDEFHDDSVKELAERIGIDLKDEEDEEEDEE